MKYLSFDNKLSTMRSIVKKFLKKAKLLKIKRNYNIQLLNNNWQRSCEYKEYVNFDDKLYQIMNIKDNKSIKLTIADYVRNNQDTYNNGCILYYLNNNWCNNYIFDKYRRMMIEGICYLEDNNRGNFYF